MSPPQQLDWPKPATEPDLESTGSVGRGSAGKNRSREGVEGVELRERAAADAPRLVRDYAEQDEARLTTRVVRSDAEFSSLGSAWDALLAECAAPNVFMSHAWLHSWWTAYQPRAELAIVLVEERGRLRGIAPLCIHTVARAGLRARVLRFIGDGTGETDHVNVLAPRADQARVLRQLFAAVDSLEWDIAEFNQVPADAGEAEALLRWIGERRWPVVVERSACPVRSLPPTFDAILASLPSRLRTSIRSSRRKLHERHAVEFGLHEHAGEVDDALRAFFANHESRWQGKGQAGAFSNPQRRAFYARLTPRLLERGWLRFFYLKLDGRPVAQQYCFAVDDTVMLLQEGFDFAHAQDNVGNVLRSLVFEHLVGAGARCYDFLAGSSRHKESWSDGHVNDLRIRCARRTLKGQLFFQSPLLLERVKDRLRPWRDRLRGRAVAPQARADQGAPRA